MFCRYCGQEINDNTAFCPRCGKSPASAPYSSGQPERMGQSVTSLVLGILGFIVWLLPIIGFPVIITGLVFGIIGRNTGLCGNHSFYGYCF